LLFLISLLACSSEPIPLNTIEQAAQSWVGEGTVRHCNEAYDICDVKTQESCEVRLDCAQLIKERHWICWRNTNATIACPGGRTTVQME
jgi:hypothetical protein